MKGQGGETGEEREKKVNEEKNKKKWKEKGRVRKK